MQRCSTFHSLNAGYKNKFPDVAYLIDLLHVWILLLLLVYHGLESQGLLGDMIMEIVALLPHSSMVQGLILCLANVLVACCPHVCVDFTPGLLSGFLLPSRHVPKCIDHSTFALGVNEYVWFQLVLQSTATTKSLQYSIINNFICIVYSLLLQSINSVLNKRWDSELRVK